MTQIYISSKKFRGVLLYALLAFFACVLIAAADHGGSGGCNQLLDFDCDGAWNNNGRTFVSEEEYFDRNIDIDDQDPSIGSQSSLPCAPWSGC